MRNEPVLSFQPLIVLQAQLCAHTNRVMSYQQRNIKRRSSSPNARPASPTQLVNKIWGGVFFLPPHACQQAIWRPVIKTCSDSPYLFVRYDFCSITPKGHRDIIKFACNEQLSPKPIYMIYPPRRFLNHSSFKRYRWSALEIIGNVPSWQQPAVNASSCLQAIKLREEKIFTTWGSPNAHIQLSKMQLKASIFSSIPFIRSNRNGQNLMMAWPCNKPNPGHLRGPKRSQNS